MSIIVKRRLEKMNIHRIKKLISYLFFGFLTTLINVLTFALCVWLGAHYLLGNILAFIVSILFAYITNKKWVFVSSSSNKIDLKELIRFVGSRISTLLLESLILFLFITWMGFNQYGVKIAANIAVIITNYLLSEFIVFQKKQTSKEV